MNTFEDFAEKNRRTIQIELNFGFSSGIIVRRWYSGLITCLVDNAYPQDRNDAWAPTPCVIYVREIDRASKARPISVLVENGALLRAVAAEREYTRPGPTVGRRGSREAGVVNCL